MIVSFRVDVDKVRGKARPRIVNGRAYTPNETVEAENAIRQAAMGKFKGMGSYPGEVALQIHAFQEAPKSWPKRRVGEAFTTTPDADNIAKLVADALNGIAWRDDSQVVCLEVYKHPRMENGAGAYLIIAVDYKEWING